MAFHCGTPCDACGIQSIEGPRYHCRQCADFDMCGTCYRNSNTVHPSHTFEEIAAPLWSWDRSRVALTPLTAETLHEFTELNSRRGVDDALVTAWLSQDSQNIDTKDIVQQDCSWMCAICQEGAELHVHGSFVKICSEGGNEAHIFHKGCLHSWLTRSNSCPVCRRTEIIPTSTSSDSEVMWFC